MRREEKTIAIANSTATSDLVDVTLEHQCLVGVVLKAIHTGTSMKIEVYNQADQTWRTLKQLNSASDFTIPTTAAGYIPLDRTLFYGISRFRFVSGSNEASARSLIVVLC